MELKVDMKLMVSQEGRREEIPVIELAGVGTVAISIGKCN